MVIGNEMDLQLCSQTVRCNVSNVPFGNKNIRIYHLVIRINLLVQENKLVTDI